MSALWAANEDSNDVESDEQATRSGRLLLRPVSLPRQRMARVPFVLVLIAVFGLGMAGLLMLNTTLQSQAFQSQQLNLQATQLTYNESALARKVDQVQAPQVLARRASALGMRANPYPGYVRITDGKVLGYPKKVKGNEDPNQIVKTPAQVRAAALKARQAADAKAAAALAKQQAKDDAAAAKAQQQADAKAQQQADTKSKSTKNTKNTKPTSTKTTKTKKPSGRN